MKRNETYTHLDIWGTLKKLKSEFLTSDFVKFETCWVHDDTVRISAYSKSGAFQDGTAELLKIYEGAMKDALYSYNNQPRNFVEIICGTDYCRRNIMSFGLWRFPVSEEEISFYIPTLVDSKLTWLTLKGIRNLSEICVDSDKNENAGLLDEILLSISGGLVDPKRDYWELLNLIDIRASEI